jgi:hypothetical protein
MIREAQGAGLVMRAEPVEARTVPFDKLRAHDSARSRHHMIRGTQGAGLVMRAEPVEARSQRLAVERARRAYDARTETAAGRRPALEEWSATSASKRSASPVIAASV